MLWLMGQVDIVGVIATMKVPFGMCASTHRGMN